MTAFIHNLLIKEKKLASVEKNLPYFLTYSSDNTLAISLGTAGTGWFPPFTFKTAVILCGTRCWKHYISITCKFVYYSLTHV